MHAYMHAYMQTYIHTYIHVHVHVHVGTGTGARDKCGGGVGAVDVLVQGDFRRLAVRAASVDSVCDK